MKVGLGQRGLLLDVDALLLDKLGKHHLATAVADNIEIARKVAEQHQLIQCGEELLARQITSRAEDNDREGHALVKVQRLAKGDGVGGGAGEGGIIGSSASACCCFRFFARG